MYNIQSIYNRLKQPTLAKCLGRNIQQRLVQVKGLTFVMVL